MENKAIKIIIEKDQPCLCESGEIFGSCCMKKNHTYEGLLRDDGSYGIYDHTEFMDSAKSLLNFIDLRIEKENCSLTFNSSSKKLKRFYEKLDNALKPIQRASSCKAGCSHCCHILVLTSKLEYEMIKKHIEDNFSESQKETLRKKLGENEEVLRSIQHSNDAFLKESVTLYNNSKIPCAFLDGDNRCTIYEVRPFICRKYLVLNDPELCSDYSNKTNQYYAKYLTTAKNSIAKLNKLTYNNLNYKHLLSWFVED